VAARLLPYPYCDTRETNAKSTTGGSLPFSLIVIPSEVEESLNIRLFLSLGCPSLFAFIWKQADAIGQNVT